MLGGDIVKGMHNGSTLYGILEEYGVSFLFRASAEFACGGVLRSNPTKR